LRGHADLEHGETLLCRRCSAPLERTADGQWKEVAPTGDRLSRD
jgi:hypothetical protein